MTGGDLEDHFRSGHGVAKKELARWVEMTCGGGREEHHDIVNLSDDKDTSDDADNKNEGNTEEAALVEDFLNQVNHKDKTTKQNMAQPSISRKLTTYDKNESFVEMKKKAIVESMFSAVRNDNSSDTVKPVITYEDIKANFAKMRKSVWNMDILASDEMKLRLEFESFTSRTSSSSRRPRGGLAKVPPAPSSSPRPHFKVPTSSARPVLIPVASDRSDMSSRGVSTYSCPLAPACSFLISKAKLKEFSLAWQHLDKTHNITTDQLKAAEGTGKFKFNKIKV